MPTHSEPFEPVDTDDPCVDVTIEMPSAATNPMNPKSAAPEDPAE